MRYVDSTGKSITLAVIAVVLLSGGVLLMSGCSNEEAPNEIIYDVPLYEQGNLSLCWAYSQVMVESFQNDEILTQEQADARARELAIQENGEEEWNDGDWPTNRKLIGRKVRTIENLRDMLVKNNGPLYAYYTRKGGAHLVVVTGVDVEEGLVFVNNPWGDSGSQSFNDFKNDVLGNDNNPDRDYKLSWVYGTK